MKQPIKTLLPWVAVLSALAAVILVIIGIPQRQGMLSDNGVTRAAAAARLEGFLSPAPASLEEDNFRHSLEALPGKAYITTAWAFAPDGRIVAHAGMMVPKEGLAGEWATAETQRLLESLPPAALSEEQRTLLQVVSAIQAEGEHNDVLRHLVREVRSPQGVLLGWVGIAYEVSPAIGAPNTAWMLSLLAWLFFMGIYWLSLPMWVWLDARQRGERAGVWALFVLIGNLVALMAYLLTRPKSA